MKSFTIKPDKCFSVWFQLYVLPTRKAMNSFISSWSKRTSTKVNHDPATAGVVQATSIREFPPEGKRRWYSDQFATMFLNENDVKKNGIEIVAHEALHCALAHERFVQHFSMDYSGDDMEHEERLCYTHGRIAVGVWNALRKKK